jgi:uncharacterized membrane protein YgcG
MHDLDRTQNQFESDYQEMEFEFDGEMEFEGESYDAGEMESVFDEVEEMEMAADLLEIQDEYELDQFLGKLISKAKKAAGGFLKSGVGKQLGGLLKGAAKAALPIVGNAILPGVGGAAASKLGSVFGLELEGLSPQDQEFEGARRFIKLAGDAARNAANAHPNAPPQQVAKAALIEAAQKHAPGLLRAASGNGGGRRPGRRGNGEGELSAGRYSRGGGYSGGGSYSGGRSRSGRWVRQGDRIILHGV